MHRVDQPAARFAASAFACLAALNTGCGTSADTSDAAPAPEVAVTPDIPVTPDADTADAPASQGDARAPTDAASDTPTEMDAAVDAPADAPTTRDDAGAQPDVPSDAARADVPVAPAEALLGVVRADAATLYRIGAGTVTPTTATAWEACPAGYTLVGRDMQSNGFWLCAASALADRRFYFGNVVGGSAAYWSLQRGNVTARGASTIDACATGSLLGRGGDATDGFWLCVDPPPAGRWAAAWEFDNTAHGWTPNGTPRVTVSGGRLTYAEGGSDPYLVSPDGLNLDATHTIVYVGLRNATSSVEARMYFSPLGAEGPEFSDTRVVYARTIPGDTTTREMVFDMGTHPQWRGTIRRLRFDPGTAPGPYEIDYLRVGPTYNRTLAPRWDFTDGAEGWRAVGGTPSAVDGVYTLRVTAADASITSPSVSFSAARTKLRLRVRNALAEPAGEVFFSTAAAPGFSAARSVPFAMIFGDALSREYVVDMSRHPAWTGTITGLRVDFGSTSLGRVEVDWIGLDE